jgi:hypothetical protein
MKLSTILQRGALFAVPLLLCTSCQSGPQAQDPFDVALGMMSMSMMTEQAPSDATMEAFAKAVTPSVVQQTIVHEAPKSQPGGAQ